SILGTICTSPGQTYLVSLFHPHLIKATGINTTQLSTAYMIGTMMSALLLTGVGKLSDRFGPRLIMGVVATLLGCVCFGMPWVTGFWTLLLGFFLLRFLGQGSLGLLSAHTVAMWFERRLGFVESIRHSAMSLAMATLPFVVAASIRNQGWQATYMFLGIGVWLLVLPCVLLFFCNKPEDIGQSLDGDEIARTSSNDEYTELNTQTPQSDVMSAQKKDTTLSEAIRTPAYWLLTAVGMSVSTVATAAMFQIQPLLQEQHLSLKHAPFALSAFATTSLIMTLCTSWIIDKLPAKLMLCCIPLLVGLGSLMLLSAHTPWYIFLAMGLMGAAGTFSGNVLQPTIARVFGRTHHGAIRGSMTTSMVVGTSVGPVVLGLSKDYSGSFSWGLLFFGVACTFLCFGAITLRLPRSTNPQENH
ncbi:MAG: MFS transporter, partial [Myxococcota bacterium]